MAASLKSILLVILLLAFGCAPLSYPGRHTHSSDYKARYNYMEEEYKLAPKDWKVQYNYMEERYEYAPPNSKPKYNYMEERYELVPR